MRHPEPSNDDVAADHDVSRSDIADSFRERGYADPVQMFDGRQCISILTRLRQERRPPLDWNKGCAASSRDYFTLATDDRILDLVTTLIGEDVLLWGARLLARGPGQVHPWHTDIESSAPTAEVVSVWIGLAHTNRGSSLKLVPFSHRFGATLQQVVQEQGEGRTDVGDADVSRWARERDSRSGVLPMDTQDGEALVFDGRLWHGSANVNQRGTRHAVLLQYATPKTAIRIPDLQRLAWPFESWNVPRAPCIVVSGRDDEGLNRITPGPVMAVDSGSAQPALTSRIHHLHLPLEQDEVGWKPHRLFSGTTPAVNEMRCHVSVLDPGQQPHPPHRHDDEEILLILDGQCELVLEDVNAPGATVREQVRRGMFAYYPAGFAHTLENTSSAPVTYLMFKWITDGDNEQQLLQASVIAIPDAAVDSSARGYAAEPVFDGATRYLRRLQAHVTTMRPAGSYAPHVDSYDVGIAILEGTVETLGERVGRNGVIFYAAGQAHGMHNVSDEPARYVVFEFHGRSSGTSLVADRRLSVRAATLARNPGRLRGAVVRRGRRLLALMRGRLLT